MATTIHIFIAVNNCGLFYSYYIIYTVFPLFRQITIIQAIKITNAPRLMLEQPTPFQKDAVLIFPRTLNNILKSNGFRIHIQAGRQVFFLAIINIMVTRLIK